MLKYSQVEMYLSVLFLLSGNNLYRRDFHKAFHGSSQNYGLGGDFYSIQFYDNVGNG